VRLPEICGTPVEVRFVRAPRDRRGEVHGVSHIRERRITLDAALRRGGPEYARILVHELFHFVWVRLGNTLRQSWEDLIASECAAGVPGELGWSAEWRKLALLARDRDGRTRRWREYCCESFCDTAAWLFSGIGAHEEFTLAAPYRRARRGWFVQAGLTRVVRV
jgi:hypothetical protein